MDKIVYTRLVFACSHRSISMPSRVVLLFVNQLEYIHNTNHGDLMADASTDE